MTPWEVTETQRGAIAEQIVATRLILASDGRLSPFQPLADDMGIDLLVYDKETGKSIPLQIKSRTKALNRHPNVVHFQVREATFDSKRPGYVLCLFVRYDCGKIDVERAWLIPMADFKNLAAHRENSKTYAIRPSKTMESSDKFTSYRCHDLREVTNRIICDLNGNNPA